jgi:hypothetical protein
MILIQLWRHNALLSEQTVPDRAAAERAVDRLINDVHHGRHGEGRFKIEADKVNELGLFMGKALKQPKLKYPPAPSRSQDNKAPRNPPPS